MSRLAIAVSVVALTVASGCGEVSSYAVRTTSTEAAAHRGPIAVFASRMPQSGRELGIVEAHGYGDHGSIELLFPELTRRTAELGGNALVLDWIGAKPERILTWTNTLVSYPCGPTYCTRNDTVAVPQEVLTVVLRGRAFLIPPTAPEAP